MSSHQIDGAQQIHSALLVVMGEAGRRELSQRIWQAQLSVLFPYLEQERVSLVCELGPLLKPPFQAQFGQITDAADLELGPLLSQVYGCIDKSLRMHLGNLVRVRNALARLEPVSAADVEALHTGMRRGQGG